MVLERVFIALALLSAPRRTGRVHLAWRREAVGGAHLGLEPQRRADRTDTAIVASSRHRFGAMDHLTLELRLAHEDPSFDQRSLGLYYRKAF